jgi:hypothetical protein
MAIILGEIHSLSIKLSLFWNKEKEIAKTASAVHSNKCLLAARDVYKTFVTELSIPMTNSKLFPSYGWARELPRTELE